METINKNKLEVVEKQCEQPAEKRVFFCLWKKSGCNVTADSRTEIIQHQEDVHMPNVYVCWDKNTETGCRQEFKRLRYLEQHQLDCKEIDMETKNDIHRVMERRKYFKQVGKKNRTKVYFAVIRGKVLAKKYHQGGFYHDKSIEFDK